ncbi:MAG: PQQ-binding-like beta-propeller repeat protein [Eubacteriales bacterium]|nr:PQQ-binding-like beta-propeller repeat protein [Eubacteriales bacterium]MCI6979516.1 PQQ-binding-like beta-propeller repeat protein [Clostridiales bacterium]MDD6721317.1 PQQ-binding-like beta-propeller repeat protein [Clostridiales bacterium]MDY5694320.1 PQQ-binding-like beta-propeller repeat protein [Eubacteriales bacterium]
MKTRRRRRRRVTAKFIIILVLFIIALTLGILLLKNAGNDTGENVTPGASTKPSIIDSIFGTPEPDVTPTETVPAETPEPTPTPLPDFNPTSVQGTRPSDFGMEAAIEVNGQIVSSYQREQRIDFGPGSDYTDVEGVITFRGNNFRDNPAYGTANIIEKRLDDANAWTVSTGSVPKVYGNGAWTGSGWTGQPLIVRWPEDTKRIMNMYDSAKNKAGLVEVIYATMDGHIYFLDLDNGEATRKPINMGRYPFKGAGALDPRGYPLMFLGSGDDSKDDGKGSSHASIISLIDGKVLYEFGEKDGFSLRDLSYFDSSALVDAETDTLIYPGENGILYIIKLNTNYDKEAGTISVSPEVVKWRYKGARTNSTKTNDGSKGWWLGVEDSAIVWRGHIIFSDNGGHMMCLDLNTLELVWVQDVLDDTNCTAVLELENGHPYIYNSTSFHAGWRADKDSKVAIPIWKIDAVTGEVVWKNTDYSCQTISGVSGGVQGSFAIGKGSLSDMVFAPVAMTDGHRGKLVAFSKADGHVVWECNFAGYPWSSPVVVYDQNGAGYIIQCNSSGYMHLVDGQTGTILYEFSLGSNIEASPAVFENTVVVGTRGQLIYGVKIK